MARKRKILCEIEDHAGDRWAVTESRPTFLGWSIHLGRPAAEVEGGGRGGKAVIFTRELADYLEANRTTNIEVLQKTLGIGKQAILRFRKTLGINRYDDARAWWVERIDDLRSLTIEAFAAKHDRKVSIVERWRLELVGKTNRDAGWHLQPSAKEALLSPMPASHVARFLNVPVGTVGALRSKMAKAGLSNPIPAIDRMRVNLKGICTKTPKQIAEFRRMAKRPWDARRRAARSSQLRIKFRKSGKRPLNPSRPDWSAEHLALLGTTTDRQVAIITGRSISAVRSQRKIRGIKAYRIPWSMPIPRTSQAVKLSRLIKHRYESISGASRATGLDYKLLWSACDGRKQPTESRLNLILSKLGITRDELDKGALL